MPYLGVRAHRGNGCRQDAYGGGHHLPDIELREQEAGDRGGDGRSQEIPRHIRGDIGPQEAHILADEHVEQAAAVQHEAHAERLKQTAANGDYPAILDLTEKQPVSYKLHR